MAQKKVNRVIAGILVVLTIIFSCGDFPHVYAAQASREVGYELTFIDEDSGKTLYSEKDKAPVGTKLGPDSDVQVRTTWYDQDTGTDYDLDEKKSPMPTDTSLSEDESDNHFTFYYKKHSDSSTDVTDDTHYTVTVDLVDQNGTSIGTRTFSVNGRDCVFYAPEIVKTTDAEGQSVYYEIADKSDRKIVHRVGKDPKSYTIRYDSFNGKDSYKWYILEYDAKTNEVIGQEAVTVRQGETKKFTPKETMTVDGTNYTLASEFRSGLTHTYGDRDRVSYVYYEPEGWNKEEASKTITVSYRNVRTNSIIKSVTKKCDPEKTVDFSIPQEFSEGGVDYVRVGGQSDTISHSWYSPKEEYTVYYRDKKDTDFSAAVITTEETEIVTIPGRTTFEVFPGTTRYILVNNGSSSTVGVADGTGAMIGSQSVAAGGGTAGSGTSDSSGNSSASDGSDHDNSVDGIKTDKVKTPQGSIDLNDDGISPFIVVLALVCAAAIAAAAIIFASKKRRKTEDEQK
jgi:hypothetical protein